ncbi:MAG: hypothetical protein ACI36W_02295 [Coriobacteriales bacterium]
MPEFDFDIDLSAIEEAMRSACHGGPSLAGRDLLCLAELTPDEFDLILNTAATLKEEQGVVAPDLVMEGSTAALLMAAPAWPRRTALQASVARLGGSCLPVPEGADVLQGEDAPQDAAQLLDLCCSCIVAGDAPSALLEELAEWAQAPVVNAGGPDAQPLQALADAMTLQENLGGLEGAPLAFLGSAQSPLAASYLVMAALAGAELALWAPGGGQPDQELLEECLKLAHRTGAAIRVADSAADALEGAAAVTVGPGAPLVDAALMDQAPEGALLLWSHPVARGAEVDAELAQDPCCTAREQVENLLHVQTAVLSLLMGGA